MQLTKRGPDQSLPAQPECDLELVQSIGGIATSLDVSDPERFFAGALPAGATPAWTQLRVRLTQHDGAWSYALHADAGAHVGDRELRLRAIQ